MNKRNYSVTEAEKQELLRISRETRERIIAEMERAQIFQRRRKLTDYADLFLRSFGPRLGLSVHLWGDAPCAVQAA